GLPFEDVEDRLSRLDPRAAHEAFWSAIRENINRLPEAVDWLEVAFGDITPIVADDDVEFIKSAGAHLPDGALDGESWSAWTNALKAATDRKGKTLFKPLRLALTGRERGPEMAAILPVIGRERVLERLAG
ncbi:MAG: glutamate--tRNA ligase, partial [Pseudomonadota bacterium]